MSTNSSSPITQEKLSNLCITTSDTTTAECPAREYNIKSPAPVPQTDADDDESKLDPDEVISGIKFVNYRDESQLDSVMTLVGRDLSEPYSVFTYRYFLHRFPDLCIFAVPITDNGVEAEPIGCVVCKIDQEDEEIADETIVCPGQQTEFSSAATAENDHGGTDICTSTVEKDDDRRPNDKITSTTDYQYEPNLSGYMAMLAVDTSYRRSGIGTALVKRAVRRMQRKGCASVTLETEVSNKAAMKLYEERLGFMREELLVRYYLNWGDAYRLRLWLK